MRVIQKAHQAGDRVIALGTFDGVHRGHQTLISEAKSLAEELEIPLRICTFNRHPLEILRPEDPPEMLSTIPEKALAMRELGVDEMELIPFSRKTADLEPEEFLERLRSMLKLRAVVAGWNYSFGKMGRGNAELLKEDGERHGYRVLIVPPTTLADGTVISSSLIRKTLREGQILKAAELLGRDYTVTGTVTRCKGFDIVSGTAVCGFTPWIRKALPRNGKYLCRMETGSETCTAEICIEIKEGNETELLIPDGFSRITGRKIRLTPMSQSRE